MIQKESPCQITGGFKAASAYGGKTEPVHTLRKRLLCGGMEGSIRRGLLRLQERHGGAVMRRSGKREKAGRRYGKKGRTEVGLEADEDIQNLRDKNALLGTGEVLGERRIQGDNISELDGPQGKSGGGTGRGKWGKKPSRRRHTGLEK